MSEPLRAQDLVDVQPEASSQNGSAPPNPEWAKTELETMWKLTPAHVSITWARITGHGREASAEVGLSNGEVMVFERLSDIVTGQALMAELASCAGVAVNPKPLDKATSVVHIRVLAERLASETADSAARGWGEEFLGTCEQFKVDMADQMQRWDCFVRLRATDPYALASEYRTSAARHMLVPVDLSGVRYVRVGWFQSFVRQFDGTVSANQIVGRMLRVGWQRRGSEGRIKATRPGLSGQMNIRFLLVPAGWEDVLDEPDVPVPAGTRPTRESPEISRARDVSTTCGYLPNGHGSNGNGAADPDAELGRVAEKFPDAGDAP